MPGTEPPEGVYVYVYVMIFLSCLAKVLCGVSSCGWDKKTDSTLSISFPLAISLPARPTRNSRIS